MGTSMGEHMGQPMGNSMGCPMGYPTRYGCLIYGIALALAHGIPWETSWYLMTKRRGIFHVTMDPSNILWWIPWTIPWDYPMGYPVGQWGLHWSNGICHWLYHGSHGTSPRHNIVHGVSHTTPHGISNGKHKSCSYITPKVSSEDHEIDRVYGDDILD